MIWNTWTPPRFSRAGVRFSRSWTNSADTITIWCWSNSTGLGGKERSETKLSPHKIEPQIPSSAFELYFRRGHSPAPPLSISNEPIGLSRDSQPREVTDIIQHDSASPDFIPEFGLSTTHQQSMPWPTPLVRLSQPLTIFEMPDQNMESLRCVARGVFHC